MPVAGICQPMMHGHGKMGATPMSDAVTCEQHYCLHVGAALDLFYFILLLLFFFLRIHAGSISIHADLA